MQKIVPHLWFDTEAANAAHFYAAAFPDSAVTSTTRITDTPSGDCDIVEFNVMGYEFMAISAGPLFKINPSISFHVNCATVEEVDVIWKALSPGGMVLMELGEYPFSRKFGWLADKYGINWQVIHKENTSRHRITPALLFTGDVCGKAEAAAQHYVDIFRNSSLEVQMRYEKGEEPDQEGTVKYAEVILEGQAIAVMDSAHAHDFSFNEAVSLIVNCKDQQEIDYFWERLSAVPESEQCGWVKDGFGVSWQIVPENMDELLSRNPEKTTPAMLAMKKIVIADLEKAGEQ